MSPSEAPCPVRASSRTNHLCWVYDDLAAFRVQGAAFLTEGAAAGHRLQYLAAGSIAQLRRDLEQTPELAALLDSGQLDLRSLDDQYGKGQCVEPVEAVTAYAAATEDALGQGFTGFRVVAEATPLVLTPAQREAFARYEHLIDRYMVEHPFYALCAYDRRQLDESAVEIACLHPAVNAGATPFTLYATRGGVGLAGQIDSTSRRVFGDSVARTMFQHRSEVLVDAAHLDFIDHRALLMLEEQALAADARVTLRTDVSMTHRLVRLLELRAVHAEAVA